MRAAGFAVLLVLALSGCMRQIPAERCGIPSPPIIPEISASECAPGIICMTAETALAWAQWSDNSVRWQDKAMKCPGVHDSGKPMGKWKYGE